MLKYALVLIGALVLLIGFVCGDPRETKDDNAMGKQSLTPEDERVIVGKGTEAPFSGKYVSHHEDGTYHCKRCGASLFPSTAKFDSRTGWPSFDDAIPGAVKLVPDADGSRSEIVCAHCDAHLGHVFFGEGFTGKDARYCVNSVSLDFEPEAQKTETAFFAGGCFWGVEYYFDNVPGVVSAVSGYMGGGVDSPTYPQVSTGRTGHAETVAVTFDPSRVSYESLATLFFEIHDPTQVNRQGPDVGQQYRSAVFYTDANQHAVAENLIARLKEKGFKVATQVFPAGTFWKAEDYHQDYYQHKSETPYCHIRVKRFD